MFSREEDIDDPDQYFSERVWNFEERIRNVLKEHADLSEEEIQEVNVVAVGDPRPRRKNKSWNLPTCEDWFVDLWIAVSRKIQQSALSTLIQFNKHRIDLHNDENSLNPPDVETHLRNVPCHAVCIDEDIKIPDMSIDCTETPMPSLPGVQATDDIPHRRTVPVYRIIYEQLKNDDSGFSKYVKFYWEQGGQKYKVFGHIKGLMRGIRLWLKCKAENVNWQEEVDDDTTSSINV